MLTNFAQKELFYYARRVYATAINFPCIITLLSLPFIRLKSLIDIFHAASSYVDIFASYEIIRNEFNISKLGRVLIHGLWGLYTTFISQFYVIYKCPLLAHPHRSRAIVY